MQVTRVDLNNAIATIGEYMVQNEYDYIGLEFGREDKFILTQGNFDLEREFQLILGCNSQYNEVWIQEAHYE